MNRDKKKNLIVSFKPYGDRIVLNGSKVVGHRLAAEIGWEHITLPVLWSAIAELNIDMREYAHVLVLGEAYLHAVAVEQVGRARTFGTDEAGLEAPPDLLAGGKENYRTDLRWQPEWMTGPLWVSLGFADETPGIGENLYAGVYLCNAALAKLLILRHLLEASAKVGLIHVAQQQRWEERIWLRWIEDCQNGKEVAEPPSYESVFTNVVGTILERNRWLPRR